MLYKVPKLHHRITPQQNKQNVQGMRQKYSQKYIHVLTKTYALKLTRKFKAGKKQNKT